MIGRTDLLGNGFYDDFESSSRRRRRTGLDRSQLLSDHHWFMAKGGHVEEYEQCPGVIYSQSRGYSLVFNGEGINVSQFFLCNIENVFTFLGTIFAEVVVLFF